MCEYMCVCARTCAQDGKRRGGLEGTPAITADVFKMEKPLVTCVGKTTVLVQQQRLHGTYRRSGSRERTGEENRRGEEGGGVTREDSGTASVRLHSFSISRTLRAFAKASAH